MNWNLIGVVLFYGILVCFFLAKRKRFEVQGKIMVMYKTKLGLRLMDKLSKKNPKLWHFFGTMGIIIGILGMIFISYTLIQATLKLFLVPEAPPAVAPVLPGIKIPGLPRLMFWHWIITIFIVATIHEFSHGIFARLHNITVKNSGFAFLGPILAAFVEPNEKVLKRRSHKAQLSILAAGPFSNIATGLIFLILFTSIINPIRANYIEYGISVEGTIKDYPADLAGMKSGEIVKQVNQRDIRNVDDFILVSKLIKPDEEVHIKTDKNEYFITTIPDKTNPKKGIIGVNLGIAQTPKTGYEKIAGIMGWFSILFYWLALISFGIGLFNLLPLGPVDGGRMFYVLMLMIFKKEKIAQRIWKWMGSFYFGLLMINITFFLFNIRSYFGG